jgi:hypothetical protein
MDNRAVFGGKGDPSKWLGDLKLQYETLTDMNFVVDGCELRPRQAGRPTQAAGARD